MRALIGAPLVVVAAAVVGFGVGVCVDDGGTNQSARHKRTHRLDLSAFRPAGMIPALGLIPTWRNTSDSSQTDPIKRATSMS